MSIKGKTIKSKATGIDGKITGYDRNDLKVTFTNTLSIDVPFEKAEELFEMDEETRAEVRELLKNAGRKYKEHKVLTYMDSDEEFDEEDPDEEEGEDIIFEKPFEEDE